MTFGARVPALRTQPTAGSMWPDADSCVRGFGCLGEVSQLFPFGFLLHPPHESGARGNTRRSLSFVSPWTNCRWKLGRTARPPMSIRGVGECRPVVHAIFYVLKAYLPKNVPTTLLHRRARLVRGSPPRRCARRSGVVCSLYGSALNPRTRDLVRRHQNCGSGSTAGLKDGGTCFAQQTGH